MRFSMKKWEEFHLLLFSQETVNIMKEFGDYERNEGVDIETLHEKGKVCLEEWCE